MLGDSYAREWHMPGKIHLCVEGVGAMHIYYTHIYDVALPPHPQPPRYLGKIPHGCLCIIRNCETFWNKKEKQYVCSPEDRMLGFGCISPKFKP